MMLKQVISPAETEQLRKLFSEAQNVVITCHTSPDGDAIGSSLALWEYLTRKGKSATVIVPNYFPDFLKWMNGADRIVQYDRNFKYSKNLFDRADLFVALDYNAPSRIGKMEVPLSHFTGKRLMIDHHEKPENFCDVMISRPEMSSTCELLYRVLDSLGAMKDVNLHCAEDLFAGMCTDTGKFTYNSSDPEILEIAAALMRKGVNKDLVIRNIYNQYTEGRYRLMGLVLLEKLMVLPEYHASIFTLTKDELQRFKYLKGDAEGFVNLPLEIKGQNISISLREDTENPQIFVSIRTYNPIRADQMAEKYFNGGGHPNAGGGRLYCPMEEAVEIAKKAIAEFALPQDA